MFVAPNPAPAPAHTPGAARTIAAQEKLSRAIALEIQVAAIVGTMTRAARGRIISSTAGGGAIRIQ